jgi:hypothetical protein
VWKSQISSIDCRSNLFEIRHAVVFVGILVSKNSYILLMILENLRISLTACVTRCSPVNKCGSFWFSRSFVGSLGQLPALKQLLRSFTDTYVRRLNMDCKKCFSKFYILVYIYSSDSEKKIFPGDLGFCTCWHSIFDQKLL